LEFGDKVLDKRFLWKTKVVRVLLKVESLGQGKQFRLSRILDENKN